MKKIAYTPIGIIHTPHRTLEDMPIQPSGARNVQGTIEIEDRWVPGLRDLDGFSHVFLIYHLHQTRESALTVTPFLDRQPRGVFATRSPNHPNPLGLSVVRLLAVQENRLTVAGVDILDGTPLLDIKPYVPDFDHDPPVKTGWLEKTAVKAQDKRSDKRFR